MIVFGPKHHGSAYLEFMTISYTNQARNLGGLKLNSHIKPTTKSAYYHLNNTIITLIINIDNEPLGVAANVKSTSSSEK